MGIFQELLRKRYGEKHTYLLMAIDWILDIALTTVFVYIIFKTKDMQLTCDCSLCEISKLVNATKGAL
jgi:hypothetical protein